MSDDPRPENEEEEEERPRIKVTDRRLFDREGNLREDVAEEQRTSSSPHTPRVDAERPDPGAAGGGPGASGPGEAAGKAGPAAGGRPGRSAGSTASPGSPGSSAPGAAGGGPSRGGAAAGPGASGASGMARGGGGAAPDTGPGAGGSKGIDVPSGGLSAAEEEPSPRGSGGGPSASDLPRDFPAFVESQYFEALLYMGAVPHPQTGERVQDLDFARYKIDLLGMIQDKTDGNLDSEEEQFLEKVLADLRMRFTEAARGGSQGS